SAQKASSALGGAGSLNQVYGAIASAPGVSMPSNQQGWYQGVSVRGGDVDQVAYEFDGLPVTRQSDLAPIATLTSLGSQEVQVYTGGTSATSNSSGLAGYINSVIKTGTYPGYADGSLSIGGPAYYHSATVEAGGATPDRLFSYYVGLAGTNQDFRYGDQFNGASNPLYFYPLYVPTSNSSRVLDGSCSLGKAPTCSATNYGAIFSPGNSYAQASNADRETVANFHFGIPHGTSGLRDDVQLLYVVGGIQANLYSSANELGITPSISAATGGAVPYPVPWLNSLYYTGKLMQSPDENKVVIGNFPSSPGSSPGTNIGVDQRDGNWNGYSIEKLQYQKNFSSSSYLRLLGYGEYSDWFINGPTSAQLSFGSDPPDYEVLDHAFGGGATYSNQLSSKNLLSLQATYMTQKLQTYNAQFSSTDPNASSLASTGLGTVLSSYVGKNGSCYNFLTGQQWSCFAGAPASQGGGSQGGCLVSSGCFAGSSLLPPSQFSLTPGDCVANRDCTKSNAAVLAGAHWVVTENGQAAQVDDVRPYFSSYSGTDLWQPNDRLTVNFGARYDVFDYATNDLASNYPARQFWFTAYNREHCGALGSSPVWTWNINKNAPNTFGACPAGLNPMTNPGNGLYNVGAGWAANHVFQPRASFTYALNSDTVIRGSIGRYARAEASSYYQYNTWQQNLASFISQFYAYGYHTPDHYIYPDTSDNADISLEQRIKNTKFSYKVTPFYRNTQNQLQFQAINAAQGTLAGLNVGTQESYGAEFSLQYGNFAQDGLSGQLSYTHTENRIQFKPINGQSVIDSLNSGIEQYNSYTRACAGVTSKSPNWQACGAGRYAGNAAPVLANTGAYPYPTKTIDIPNPYYDRPLQPLMNTSAWYTPYDVIPTPFNAGNGYAVPDVLSAILN
ncbi:MAG: TonB-dependent receptor, partial [Candidatus Eremiobacteraeota bacterium]|nr:TonB-dependent receptor [Candidatus Eremiobacteraeota bacterium]